MELRFKGMKIDLNTTCDRIGIKEGEIIECVRVPMADIQSMSNFDDVSEQKPFLNKDSIKLSMHDEQDAVDVQPNNKLLDLISQNEKTMTCQTKLMERM
jgi:hypothetical protein